MNRMHPTGRTEFSEFQTLWIILLVLRSGIVAMFANCASQRRNNTVLFTFTGHVLLPSLIGCTDTYRGAQSTAPTWFDIFYQRAQFGEPFDSQPANALRATASPSGRLQGTIGEPFDSQPANGLHPYIH